MTAKAQLLGILDIPDGATHCQIHAVTSTGGIGQKLKIKQDDGTYQDCFPVGEVTHDWLLSWAEPGAYRFGFWHYDPTGKKLRCAPTSGAVRVDPLPSKKVKRRPDEPAAAAAAAQPDGGMHLFTMYREMQREARAESREFYAMQSERDRQFQLTMMQLMTQGRAASPPATVHEGRVEPVAAPGDDDDEEDDDEEDDQFTKVLTAVFKAGAKAAEPLLERAAEKLGVGGAAAAAASE